MLVGTMARQKPRDGRTGQADTHQQEKEEDFRRRELQTCRREGVVKGMARLAVLVDMCPLSMAWRRTT